MMLRGSSAVAGESVDLTAIAHGSGTDSGVPGGRALLRLVEAALRDPAALPEAREEVQALLGENALVDAAGVIGNFQRMVRIADSTGIPVDGRMAAASAEVRETLHLNELPSARLAD